MRLVPAALILCLASVTTSQQPQPRLVPVLVELFTSEGCSSCPPADDLLRRLIQEQPVAGVEVIGLSEHVDYWNQLGWQDPFSSSRFTSRQEEYAQEFDGNGMYTPQAVVDGRFQMIGSDGQKLRDAILSAAKAPKATVDLRTRSTSPDRVAVSVEVRGAPAEPRGDVDVMVALIENGFAIDVKRGENARRRLHHDAVVRTLEQIGRLPRDASSGTFTTNLKLSPAWARPNLKVVAFLQHRRTSHVVGAVSSRID